MSVSLAGTGQAGLRQFCREGTVQAELPAEAVKPFPPILSYEKGDKMDTPVVTSTGYSSQRLSHQRWMGPVQLQSCAKFR